MPDMILMILGLTCPPWVNNYTTAHVKLREPINIGCQLDKIIMEA